MVENEKALKEALDKLEKCCPGSTRVSHMNTASSILHKALIELDLARSQEQHFREESDALLEGISIIMNSENIEIAFKKVLEIIKGLIKFDDAFILREHNGLNFTVVVSSSPKYEDVVWQHDLMTKYILNEGLTNIRNINYSAEWRQQPSKIRQNVFSALHVALKVSKENAILICTSSKENYFNKSHIQLIKRFAPLACQALYSLKINELLNDEKSKRKQAEERLEALLKKKQNTKIWFYSENSLQRTVIRITCGISWKILKVMDWDKLALWKMEGERMAQIKLLSEEQQVNFFKFYENAKYNDIIPAKYAHMIHTAVAMAIGCYPWMEVYFGVAEEMEISEEELAAVRAMVMAVTAGRIFFQSKNIVERMKTAGPVKDDESDCSPGCCE